MMNHFGFDTAKVAVRRSKCLTQFRERFIDRELMARIFFTKKRARVARCSQINILHWRKYTFYIERQNDIDY